jgi:hypothetical protein
MTRKEYRRQWYAVNKDRIQAYCKTYRQKTKSKKQVQNKTYYDANKKTISERRKMKYKTDDKLRQKLWQNHMKNKINIRAKSKDRVANHRNKIREVALRYGCQCPECKWRGEFNSPQLHFHHKDASTKQYSVSAMGGMGLKRIAKEINKCCVLCACCHASVTKGIINISDNITCRVTESLEQQ